MWFFFRAFGFKATGSATGSAAGTSTANATGSALADGVGTAAGDSSADAIGSTAGALVGRMRRRRYRTPAPWAADEAYEQIRTTPEVRAELRQIVGPYLLAGTLPARAAPPTSRVDWDALMHDADAVYRLVVLWEEMVDEEETLLLLDL